MRLGETAAGRSPGACWYSSSFLRPVDVFRADLRGRTVDLSRIFAILFRRWYAVLPVIILVVLAGSGEVSKVKTPYEATGKMLLLSPSTFRRRPGQDPIERIPSRRSAAR